MATSSGGAGSPCKLTSAAGTDIDCDFHAPQGDITFGVTVVSGGGSASFIALRVDGQDQAVNSPLTVSLTPGKHTLTFGLALSRAGATAVIQEACNPANNLIEVHENFPSATLRICVP